MIFNCEYCDHEVIIDCHGDFSGCEHYPASVLMISNARKNDRWYEVNGELRKSSCFTNVAEISRLEERRLLHSDNLRISPKKGSCGYINPTISMIIYGG